MSYLRSNSCDYKYSSTNFDQISSRPTKLARLCTPLNLIWSALPMLTGFLASKQANRGQLLHNICMDRVQSLNWSSLCLLSYMGPTTSAGREQCIEYFRKSSNQSSGQHPFLSIKLVAFEGDGNGHETISISHLHSPPLNSLKNI